MEALTYVRLAEDAPALLAVFDEAGRFRWANASWTRELGWPRDDLRGRLFDELVHPDDQAEVRRLRREGAAAAATDVHRARLRHRGGDWFAVEWFVRPFAAGRFYAHDAPTAAPTMGATGGAVRVAATAPQVPLLDLAAELAAVREQLARDQRLVTVGTFAAGVGHEVADPLRLAAASIDATLRELQRPTGDPSSRRERDMIAQLVDARSGLARIASVIGGLRAFARDDAPARPVDLRAVIEAATGVAANELGERATCRVDHGDVPPVEADEARLGQVLVSLLQYAVASFAGGDPGRNRIALRTRRVGENRVELTIRDNGAGIPAETLARIFEPVAATTSSGGGLGLAIARVLVQSFGGDLTCESTVGVGTTFTIGLRSTVVVPAAPSAIRVVIIDDEPKLAEGLTRILRRDGYQVEPFSDPRAAPAHLRTVGADVVLCDLMMPKLNGQELHERLSPEQPELARRFIFMTGGSPRADLRRFLASVDNPRLDKPFALVELRALIQNVVEAAATR